MYKSKIMNTINERIKMMLLEEYKGNVSEFARRSGVPQPTLNNIVGNRLSKPSADNLALIINSNELINARWLLTGEGDMHVSKNEVNVFEPEALPKRVGELYRSPVYHSLPVSAGDMGLSNYRNLKPDGYAYTTMPGVTFFPVVGCSFEPIIKAGHYIGIVKLDSWDRIDTEKIYFILTREERMIKRLRLDDIDDKCLWCVSPNFREFKILKQDVIEISHVFFYGMMV